MSPRIRRVVITLVVLGFAAGVVLVSVLGPTGPTRPAGQQQQTATQSSPQTPGADPAAEPEATAAAPVAEASPGDAADQPPPGPISRALEPVGEVHAEWVSADKPARPLGSLDPRQAKLYLEFSLAGAGLERITLSEFWQTAAQGRRAAAHYAALDQGQANPPPLPDEADRYVLQTAQPFHWFDAQSLQWQQISVPLLAAHTIVINGQPVRLLNDYTDENGKWWTLWSERAPGEFEATIVDADGQPIVRIRRRFVLGADYDITIEQRAVNLTDGPLDVQWIQYGPGDLIEDRARYMDRRRFRFGFLPDPQSFPDLVVSGDSDLLLERADVTKRAERAEKAAAAGDPARERELLTLWPNETSRENQYVLSWFASTNRYFALAVHPMAGPDGFPVSRSLEATDSEIRAEVSTAADQSEIVFTALYSPLRTIAAGGEAAFDLGVYAGPLDPRILAEQQPMASLKMQGLILYQMSAWCAICTFQWLAVGLLKFLTGVHFLVADWGVAIILLVVVVRTLLHPLTKKAQVNMQRFGKVMGDLKPEIEKLQKKYPNDPKKLQQEQMRLMRERGVNPFQLLGCLPLILQMPIWVALYAMLYFAFELRHQPAFWGFFQIFWEWPFLADLSAADHCFWEFQEPFRFFMWNMTGINLLPILLGVVFFVQQKYMAPPPSPSMTKEQIQQQKIMKVMMVVMFPVMLYSAPSGLTLYICTSSFLGIVESRYIRRHVSELDLAPPKPKAKPKRKPKDPQARAFADAIERAKAKAKAKRHPPKRYKQRRK